MPSSMFPPPLNWQSSRMFYLAPEAWGSPFILEGQEAQHLVKVLRLRSGDEIRLMDGAGREGRFIIQHIAKHRVELEEVSSWQHPPHAFPVILATAWTKSARRSWLFEKLLEFEAQALWLWQAERSQFPVPQEGKTTWDDQCIAGAKQCRNPWLPEIVTMPNGVEELVSAAKDIEHRYVLLEEDHKPSLLLSHDMLARQGTSLYVIGPEGGLSPREAKILTQSGFIPVSLGQRVLRWETAAMLCLGLHWWSKQGRGNQP